MPERESVTALGFVSAGKRMRGETLRAPAAIQAACALSGGSGLNGNWLLITSINLFESGPLPGTWPDLVFAGPFCLQPAFRKEGSDCGRNWAGVAKLGRVSITW